MELTAKNSQSHGRIFEKIEDHGEKLLPCEGAERFAETIKLFGIIRDVFVTYSNALTPRVNGV